VDINEYISSGVLELYVAGSLSPDENRDVEEMAGRHEEVRDEIEAILSAFEAIAAVPGVNPRPELRATILDQIDQLEHGAGAPPHTVPASHASTPAADPLRITPRAPVLTLPPRARYLLAASIALTIVSSAAATYFAYQWRAAERELAVANTENLRVAQDRNMMKARLDKSAGDLAVIRQHDNRVVQMKGLPAAPGALATVYWNPQTREVHLDKGSLPAPPPGKQYQLWAIADGKPLDAGMIANGSAAEGLERMKSIAQAEAFAVTLEPEGGSVAPTLDAMFVMGTLGT
jgi:anti-sigma-K factor RskA